MPDNRPSIVTTANLVSLPMYNLPELANETEAFLTALSEQIKRETGIDPEVVLTPDAENSVLWHRHKCLFSQSCGFPLMHEYSSDIQALAIPDYATTSVIKGQYRSVFITQNNSNIKTLADARGSIAAINDWDSQS